MIVSVMFLIVQVGQAFLVKKVLQDFQGLLEKLVETVDQVKND